MSFSKRSRIFAGATLVLLGATALPANAQQDQRRPRPPEPTISIGDASIVEGNSGRQNLTFTVTLSEPTNRQVRADWRTRTGTANNRDFRADDGTVRFRNGATTATISVAINGDTAVEPDETFTVVLRDPDRATVADATATGTIVNDDGVAVVTLSSIAIAPAGAATLIKGSTAQFTATGAYSDGTTADVSSQVTWASSGVAVGISATGLASANSVGTATVTAKIGSVASAGTVVTVSPATLLSIAVTPATATVVAGLTQQFVATGSYSDGTSAPIASAAWSTNELASITTSGLAKGLSAGSASVTASLNGVSSPTATLNVTPATVVSVVITKGLDAYDTTTYVATATYTDGSSSTNATWASSDTGVGLITPSGEFNKGVVGTTTLTATIGGVSKTLVVAVDKRISGITLTPESASIPKGKTQQLVLTAQFNDGSFLPITSGVTFASNSSSASVNNTGLVTAMSSEGSAVITASNTASYLSGGVSVSRAFTATTNITTTPAVATAVTAIATTFTGSVLPGGVPVQYTATGTFSDGTNGDVTNLVTWSATNGSAAGGLFIGNNASTAVPNTQLPGTVTATLNGTAATASLSVLNNLSSIVLSSKFAPPSAAPTSDADVRVFKSLVTGTLVNGEKLDVTELSTFGSDNPTTWTISNAAGTRGEASVPPGNAGLLLKASIAATAFSSTLAIKAPPSGIFLNAPQISSLSPFFNGNLISFPSAAAPNLVFNLGGVPSLVEGSTYDLVANSGFTNPEGTALSELFGFQPTRTFQSSNPAVGTIVDGKFVAVGPGQTVVSFSVISPYSNGQILSVPVPFTVRAPVSMQLLLPQPKLPSAQTMIMHSVVTFDNGQSQDLGFLASVTSADNGIANPYPAARDPRYPAPAYNAYLLGQNPGVVTLTSTWRSLTATATVTTVPRIAYVTLGATSVSLTCPTFDQVRMIATLTDGTTADITGLDRTFFGTTNAAVVRVSNSFPDAGRLTPFGPGTASITGTYFYYDNGQYVRGVTANTIPIVYPCGDAPST
jgi:trimeric autotransporter adhesin